MIILCFFSCRTEKTLQSWLPDYSVLTLIINVFQGNFHHNKMIQLSNSNPYTTMIFYRMDDKIITVEYSSPSRNRHSFCTNGSFMHLLYFFRWNHRIFTEHHCSCCVDIFLRHRCTSCDNDDASFFPIWKRNTSPLEPTENLGCQRTVSICEESHDHRCTFYFIWWGTVVLVSRSVYLGVYFFHSEHAVFSFRGRKKTAQEIWKRVRWVYKKCATMDPTVYPLGKNVRAWCYVLSEYPIATKSSIEQENVLNNLDSRMILIAFNQYKFQCS